MANPDNAVKVPGASSVGVGYSFTLAVLNIDGLLMGKPTSDSPVGCWASAGGASMGWVRNGVAHPSGDTWSVSGWSDAENVAVSEWAAGVPALAVGGNLYLFAASAGADTIQFKCFGSAFRYEPEHGFEAWHGDTEWVLAGTHAVSNLECRLVVADKTSSRYVMPRRWSDRVASYQLYTMVDETPTTMTDTLGDMSHTYTVDLSPDENGKIDPQGGAANYLNLYCGLGMEAPRAFDLSYCEVRDVACLNGAAPFNLTCSFWAPAYDNISDGPHWKASEQAPPDTAWATPGNPAGLTPVWHCLSSGNTLMLQCVEPGPGFSRDFYRIYIGTCTRPFGPVRFNVMAGRFGRETENFPIAPLVSIPLVHYTDETHSESVPLPAGSTSEWYLESWTTLAWDGSVGLTKDQYVWGGPYRNVVPVIDEDWLEANGELLGGQDGAPDNRACYIQLASVTANPETTEPQWGPAVSYAHDDISADIPPGQTDRPSKWMIGGVESGYDDEAHPLNPTWTITGAEESVTRTLLSRKPARFDYLCSWTQQTPALPPYNPDWPMINRANFWGAGDTPAMIEAIPIEDVVNYDNSRLLEVSFAACPEGLDPTTVKLSLTHSHFDFVDANYTPPNYGSTFRFGAGSDFADSYERTQRVDDFQGSGQTSDETAPEQGWTFCFDLGQLRRGNTVHLQHVDQIEITGLPEGNYELADWRLIEDPDSHEPV